MKMEGLGMDRTSAFLRMTAFWAVCVAFGTLAMAQETDAEAQAPVSARLVTEPAISGGQGDTANAELKEGPSPAAGNGLVELQPLELGTCLRLALERNLDLQMVRLERREADYDIAIARGAYDPSLSVSYKREHAESSGQNAGTAEGVLETARTESDDDTIAAGLGGLVGPFGTSYELSAKDGSSSGTRARTGFDTSSARVGVSVSQPLLKGFRMDDTRYQIATARLLSQESALALEEQIQNLLANVEKAWYALLAARQARNVQSEALALAEQLLADNRQKVKIGTMSALDEKQAESQAASARADLASANQAVIKAENALKALVWADLRSIWQTELPIAAELPVPPDGTTAPDAGLAMEKALAQRPDLRTARLALERQELAVDLYHNQTLPELDLVGGYGLAASDEDSRGDAWDTVSDADEPYWNVGVTLTIPLGNRQARNRHLKSLSAQERQRLQVRKLEEGVLSELVDAAAAVESCLLKIAASRDAAEYARDALTAEQRKLDQGKSTSFVVLQLQKDLTEARRAETAALADYHQALADFALAEGSVLERHGFEFPDAE